MAPYIAQHESFIEIKEAAGHHDHSAIAVAFGGRLHDTLGMVKSLGDEISRE